MCSLAVVPQTASAALFGPAAQSAAELLLLCANQTSFTNEDDVRECAFEQSMATKLPAASIDFDTAFVGAPTGPGSKFPVTWDLSKASGAFLVSPNTTVELRALTLKGAAINTTTIQPATFLQLLAFRLTSGSLLRLVDVAIQLSSCSALAAYQSYTCQNLLPSSLLQVRAA